MDCGSKGCGFESHLSPLIFFILQLFYYNSYLSLSNTNHKNFKALYQGVWYYNNKIINKTIFNTLNLSLITNNNIINKITQKRLVNTPIIKVPTVWNYSKKTKILYKYSLVTWWLNEKSYFNKELLPKPFSFNEIVNPVVKPQNNFRPLFYTKYLFYFNWFYIYKYFQYFLLITEKKINWILVKIFYLLTSKLITNRSYNKTNSIKILKKTNLFSI